MLFANMPVTQASSLLWASGCSLVQPGQHFSWPGFIFHFRGRRLKIRSQACWLTQQLKDRDVRLCSVSFSGVFVS